MRTYNFTIPATFPISLSLGLFACNMGLQPNKPIIDTAEVTEPSEEPSIEPSTDTQDTQDTTPTTGFLPNLITSVSPLYGSTNGGTDITIMGGPFTSDATVKIGGYNAVVRSNSGSMIRVSSPSSAVAVSSEIRVDMDDGYGISSDNFTYFTDALGNTSAIGVVTMIEYLGNYWQDSQGNPLTNGGKEGNVWTAFINPIDFHWWQYNTPILDTCARRGIDANNDGNYDDVTGDGVVNSGDYYSFSGNLSVIDINASSITMQGVNPLTLSRQGNDPNSVQYYLYDSGSLDPAYVPDNGFFTLMVESGYLKGLSVAQFARASRSLSPISPNLTSVNSINRTQVFSWSPSSADWIEIRLYSRNTSGAIVSDIICNVQDDGNFTIQNIHQNWTTNDTVYVTFSRVYESDVTLPHNDGISRMVGVYTVIGAGTMN